MKLKFLLMTGALLASTPFTTARAAEKDIVETAVAAGSFKTLAAALGAADLVDALKGDGPFTVFAPTDEAFAKLPAGTVESLLKPENKDKLIDILTYHVVSGKVPAETAVTLNEATALNKKKIKLAVKGDALFLNESKVIKTDINCSNGVIHVIDSVLMPPSSEKASAVRPGTSKRIAAMAIAKGTPLFNDGHHGACADIYEMAAMSLLEMPGGTLSECQSQSLQAAMKKVAHSHCSTSNAWTMRHALDKLMAVSSSN